MDLPARWPLPDLLDVRDELLAAYGAPSRRYHDLRHLTEVLDRVDELLTPSIDRLVVVLAAWFHDGVYECSPSDEERSARWAESVLPDPVAARVARLVRMTATHAASDEEGAVLSDADLAILAADPARYAEYAAAVRAEYAHVPDDAFRAGRAAVLQDLLAKPTLFATPLGQTRWEDRARANLTEELARLSA